MVFDGLETCGTVYRSCGIISKWFGPLDWWYSMCAYHVIGWSADATCRGWLKRSLNLGQGASCDTWNG